MAATLYPDEKGAYHMVADVEAHNDKVPTPAPEARRHMAMPSVLGRVIVLVVLALIGLMHTGFYRSAAMPCMSRHEAVPLSSLSIADRVDRILSTTPLIDGHNDFAIFIRAAYKNHIYGDDFRKGFEKDGLPQHVDLPRLRAGKNGGAFWSVFVGCPANGTDYSDDNYADSVRDTFQQIDVVNRVKALYPDVFSPSVNGSTAMAAFARGQLISPLGVEGLHQIGNSAANLRQYHALGARYVTLTHNCGNRYADAALWEAPLRKAPAVWGGLSHDGRQLVREMNRLGLIVDLSHTSVDTMVDVLGGRKVDEDAHWTGSLAPVIYSHSSAYSLCPHPRNVPDDVLQLVRARRSLVMINFAPDFVSCRWDERSRNGIPSFDPANSTLEHVADHVLHIGHLIGFEHVGFGSDFDGIPSTPRGLDDVAAYPALVAELLRRGVSDADAALVAGGNLLRVWREVDEVALRLQAEGAPVLEDDLPEIQW
ncbi:microsomal dipeptidase precursor [Grosmannia clavigera kw1407]|uniref:Dipeptidase n=1 Tax=Grosmannia clavigera (strain kw1407 / UAMH 11150) TaxID=655863 RepID=F0XEN8_GROCL|nr:microsomal dipeptidase precursor [Grosmannia clavigera kw1407]EFX04160.1 microsomal dipeptidase precursor [Grosmannia clavigera kw1407]